ncbi:carboxypeptidase regulatory-like domain-containing protein [bacterium]|nr:carboxypeptidase regulatory-like domain-containing protein [bacterium]
MAQFWYKQIMVCRRLDVCEETLRRLLNVFTIGICMSFLVIISVSAGEITGNVTESSTGQPISGLDMNLYDQDWNFIDINAQTSGGEYRFYEVPAGIYYVRANPKYPFHYQHKYWQNSPDRDGATSVTVHESGEVTGIDFSLDDGWYIEGKISDIDGVVLGGIDINLYDMNWKKLDVDAESDEYGRYHIGGLPGGDYYVMANPVYMEPYVDQFYDHSAGPLHAVSVTLAPPDDLVNISFNLVHGSYIRGRITDKDTGDPLVGFWVKAYNENGNKMRLVDQTDSDGRFTLGAYAVGNYYVKVDPSYPDGYMDTYYPGVYQMSDAQLVAVTTPKPTYNINIPISAGSYICGVVNSVTGTPLDDIKIKFYDRDWENMEMATTLSKSDGNYLSGALKPGKYYVKAVPIYPQPWIDVYYPDGIEDSQAEFVSVALAGETLNIDFGLEPGGYLMGKMLHESGGFPLIDVDLDVYDDQWGWIDYSDHTNSSGNFLIGALPFGNYYLRADPSLVLGYIPQLFDHAFMPDDATLINLTLGQNPDALDFTLSDGGFVSGTVTDIDTGQPLENIEIELMDMAEQFLPIHTIRSRADGTYIAHGIPTGTFYVMAAREEDDGYETQYFSESATVNSAQTVNVTATETTTEINFSLIKIPEPSPTPAVSLGVELEMPGEMFREGDIFYLNARVSNSGQPMSDIPLFLVLDVLGALYFWPSWIGADSGFDFETIELEQGIRIIPILPAFSWPEIEGSVSGLLFYGAMTRQGFSRLLGDMDFISFGYTDQ